MMTETHDLKKIPYGVSDFNDFRVKNLYYVDKTRFIRDIEEKGSYLFLIRPRRFGKSLLLAILEAYYDIFFKDRFDFLFSGTDIHRNPTTEKNSYMVLKLNFSAVSPDISRVEEAFLHYIKKSALRFLTKYARLLNINIKTAREEFASLKSPSEAMITLLDYCKEQEQKLYVIIDEYDNFANTILSEAGEQAFEDITHGSGFLRAFFNVLKAGTTDIDAPISRLFITGVSPITMDDVTSGFNIGSNISLHSDLNEILGFTRTEVETMIEYYRQTGKIHHSTPELLEMMSQWYNHYRFSLYAPAEVFNTVHVLYFLKEYMIDSQLPGNFIDHNVGIDYKKLRHLIIIDKKGAPAGQTNGNFSKLRQIMESDSIHSAIVDSFPVYKLVSPENFVSLLYYFGLLTITGIDEEKKAILKIPNESIKRLYYDYIKETYEETGAFTLNLSQYEAMMKEMAFNGQWEPLIEYLVQQVDKSMGIRDLITGERAIQAFLNVYLGLSALYLVYSEKELEKGYSDLVLEPFLAQYPQLKYSYLIEIKYIKPQGKKKTLPPGNIKKVREEAEDQLKRYSLDDKFQKAIGQTTLKKVILIFSGTRLVYHGEI
ncbi:MAG: AAA family ATPase [Candidatus Aminicenantes bacterium]|nr:AAA family ATPase [Candidatus Aminicenantes bacterium]